MIAKPIRSVPGAFCGEEVCIAFAISVSVRLFGYSYLPLGWPIVFLLLVLLLALIVFLLGCRVVGWLAGKSVVRKAVHFSLNVFAFFRMPPSTYSIVGILVRPQSLVYRCTANASGPLRPYRKSFQWSDLAVRRAVK